MKSGISRCAVAILVIGFLFLIRTADLQAGSASGPFQSVQIQSFSGSVEAILPSGERLTLTSGETPPEISPDLSGIMFRVLDGSLTLSVVKVQEGAETADTLVYEAPDLIRITMSPPDREGHTHWKVFLSADGTTIDVVESVRISNFVGSIEVFFPNGEHRLLKTGETAPEITPDVSGIIFRVLKGTLTMEVSIIDPDSGETKYTVREFVTSDLVRIILSKPDKHGESQWQIFVNQSFTSVDRQIRNQVEGGRAGEGSIDETGFIPPPTTEPPGIIEIPEEPASPDGE